MRVNTDERCARPREHVRHDTCLEWTDIIAGAPLRALVAPLGIPIHQLYFWRSTQEWWDAAPNGLIRRTGHTVYVDKTSGKGYYSSSHLMIHG